MPENIKKLIIGIPLVCLAVIPPIIIDIPVIVNSNLWFELILVCGFLGILFLYSKALLPIKLITLYLFVSSFFSKAPYLSFTSYIVFITVAYYYLLCLELKDFGFVFKIAVALLILNSILAINQSFGGDTLLNFSQITPVCFGTIGNPMWLGSLLMCLAPFLLGSWTSIIALIFLTLVVKSTGMLFSLLAGAAVCIMLNFRRSVAIIGIIACVMIGIVYMVSGNDVYRFNHSRGPVWKRTISMVINSPIDKTKTQKLRTLLFGYGMGTYKVIFPVFSSDVAGGYIEPPSEWQYEGTKGYWLAWRQTHNCFLQILFEAGLFGFSLFVGMIGFVSYFLLKLPRSKETITAIVGLTIVSTNMVFHYPTRMIQSVLLLVVFLAYCQKLIQGRNNE